MSSWNILALMEQQLIASQTGASHLGFAVLLKYFQHEYSKISDYIYCKTIGALARFIQ